MRGDPPSNVAVCPESRCQSPPLPWFAQVSVDGCRLLLPELPELDHLRTSVYSPGELLMKLAIAGLNLLPEDSDPALVSTDKVPIVAKVRVPTRLVAAARRLLPMFTSERRLLAFRNGRSARGSARVLSRSRHVSQIPALENAVYADVSMLAVSFSIAHSKWNQRFGSDVAVVRVKETLEYDIRPADVHEVRGC
jgi:hypothetical protein